MAACHVTSSDVITRPGSVNRVSHPEGRVAGRPILRLTDEGTFAFVEPLACPTEEIVTEERARRIETGPNLATFVVGVIATAIGGVLLVRGASDDDKANPITYGGAVLLAGGLPFAVGPWLGNGSELQPLEAGAPLRRPGPAEPCGQQPLANATAATLAVRGIEVYGAVDARGVFAVSPFAFVDRFSAGNEALQIEARIEMLSGARTTEATFAGRDVRRVADVQRPDFDARLEPLRMVPNLVAKPPRVTLDGAAVRISLAIDNAGPGPTYQLRGRVAAPGLPALDGRVLYFGYIAKNASLARELVIPLAPKTADRLRGTTIELAIELRDAHDTASHTPVRFRGELKAP